MSNNPIKMNKLRQIIRPYCQGTGIKAIHRMVGTSRTTVRKYVRLGEDIYYYSVPYTYIGKKVKVLYTSDMVQIYYHYTQVASHKRNRTKYHYTTDKEYLASQHRFLIEWTPEKFIREAEQIHGDVARYIAWVLEHGVYPEKAYKSCSGILSFTMSVGPERPADACRWTDNPGQYKTIRLLGKS